MIDSQVIKDPAAKIDRLIVRFVDLYTSELPNFAISLEDGVRIIREVYTPLCQRDNVYVSRYPSFKNDENVFKTVKTYCLNTMYDYKTPAINDIIEGMKKDFDTLELFPATGYDAYLYCPLQNYFFKDGFRIVIRCTKHWWTEEK